MTLLVPKNKCAKFHGSCAIVDLVDLASSCHRASKIFFVGNFVGLKVFVVSISSV